MRLLRRSVVFPVLLGTALLMALLYVGSAHFMVQSLTSATRYAQLERPDEYALSFAEVAFASRDDGLQLSGWYLPGAVDAPHLIFVHGLNNVRSGDRAVALASRLVERGYNVLLFDLRGHGSSQDGTTSAGYYERRDVWGAYDYLTQQRGAIPGSVGLVGFSMGASTAILAAAGEPGIRAVVADSPYAIAAELFAQEAARQSPFPEWLTPVFTPMATLLAAWRHGIDIDALAPEAAVARLDYPALVIHGDADNRIPFRHGERVAAAGRPGTALWRVPATKHTDAFKSHPDEYTERVAAYLDARLK